MRLCVGAIIDIFSVLTLFPPAQIRKTETLKASAVDSQSRSLNLWPLVQLADWDSRSCLEAPPSPGVQPGAQNSPPSPQLLPEGSPCSANGHHFAPSDFPSPTLHIQLLLCPLPLGLFYLFFFIFTRGISLSNTLIYLMFYAGCLSSCLSGPHPACPLPNLFQEPLSRLQIRVSAAQSVLCT